MASVPLTSLDPSEANAHLTLAEQNQVRDAKNRETVSFRHSGSRHERNLVRKALIQSNVDFRIIQRWDNCGSFASVERTNTEPVKFRIRCDRCHHRYCPACSRERSWIIAKNVEKKVEDQTVRFVTLTLKHREESVELTVDRIWRSFKELRRSKLWKKQVDGGIAFVEIKATNGWHVHLHVLITGRFLDYKELRRTWLKITKDSFVVDVRLVRNPGEVVSYVCKYASKSLDRSTMHDSRKLGELIQKLAGKRLFITFGDWRGWRVADLQTSEEWVRVDSLASILRRANLGDEHSRWIVQHLINGADYLDRQPDEPDSS